MDRIELFERELDMIENDDIKSFAAKALENLPDYFFEVAASSSGKYHPHYALGDGGLVRHTQAAIRFANHLLSIEQFKNQFTDRERDMIIVALMLHDGWKQGDQGNKHTIFEHPQVAADWVRNSEILNDWMPMDEREIVADAIASHMGEWNTNRRSSLVLKKPQNKIQKFVHMCDYLASRKDIEVQFDDYKKPEIPPLEDYILTFGKHRGEKLVDVARSYPNYISWCKENVGGEPIRTLLNQL